MGYIEDLRALIGHRRVNFPGAITIIEDEQGRILMQQRAYPHGIWGLPGGIMELGESAEDTARREVFEEAGLRIGALELLGVYSGEHYLCRAANGDEFYTVTIAYLTREYEGEPHVHDDESLSFEWVDPHCLPEQLPRTQRAALADYLRRRGISGC